MLSHGRSTSLLSVVLPALALACALVALLALAPASASAAPPAGEGLLTVTPTNLPFAATTAGTSSPEGLVELRNESSASISLLGFGVQGAEPSEFGTGQSTCNPTLPIGATCQVGVLFTPHGTGLKQAQLRIDSSDEAGSDLVGLSGSGVPAQLTFEPGSYDFGLQPVHGEGGAETNLQVRNTGSASLHVENTGIEGSGSEAFELGGGDCPGADLAPGQTCSLGVRFRPRGDVAYAADVRVNAAGTGFTASLRGEGGDPMVTADPAALDFGTLGVGAPGLTRTITFANSGDLPADFFIAFLTGGDVADFSLLSEDCTEAPLEPGASCGAQIRFAPTAGGAKSAKLTLIPSGGEPMQVPIGGTGAVNALALAPSGLSFAPQGIGGSSGAQTATLTNPGPSPIEVDAASVTGPGADQFRLADSCVGTRLEPGQSCGLAVRFVPDSEGSKSATLRVLAGGQRLSASLSGTAFAAARVSFDLAAKPLQARGSTLGAGSFSCEAQSPCSVTVRASIVVRSRVGRRVRTRTVGLTVPPLSVTPGSPGPLSLQLPPKVRGLIAGAISSRLELSYGWGAEGQTGQGSVRRALR